MPLPPPFPEIAPPNKKNVPVTLWPDAPDPRTQTFGAAGLSGALNGIDGGDGLFGRRLGRYPPWKDPWGVMEEGGGRGPVPV